LSDRESLVIRVCLGSSLRTGLQAMADVKAALDGAEAYVAELEKAPDEPVQCPCCEKLVTLCVKHYELRAPGQPCATCKACGKTGVG